MFKRFTADDFICENKNQKPGDQAATIANARLYALGTISVAQLALRETLYPKS